MITVLVATILHAAACIIAPPFEFGHNRLECFFFAFLSGSFRGFPLLGLFRLLARFGLGAQHFTNSHR
jgi:hypothetical protein